MNRTLLFLAAILLLGLLWYRYRQPNVKAGDRAPEFSATLINGETVRLSDLRGKYVLLQFWGSWCGPCRQENPYLVYLYRQYHDQGFEIFSIGVEKNENAWKRAMEKDSMNWTYHTSDLLEFEGQLPKLFNVHSIPATFLLNPEGVLMGVNLPPDRLEFMLKQALSSR